MKDNFPARKDWVIPRPRIEEILTAGLEYPLVTVVAGPGYGKTTAVRDFCRSTNRKVFWLHLLPIDNDPDRFWSRCYEALQHEMPRLSEDLTRSGFPETMGDFHFYLKAITKELYADTEALIVFDSAENITNPKVSRFINSLVNVELENLCVIFISNTRPGFDRLVGNARCFQIGAGDLQFTEEETRRLFTHYGANLSDEECVGILNRTGGWPLALHLMASHPDKAAHRSYSGISHLQAISGLFRQNYFSGYTKEMQAMLVKLSYFDGVAPGLVQALDAGDPQRTMREFAENIFISYDDSQGLFYFQRMYRDFLKQGQPALSRSDIFSICSNAGSWFRKNGQYLEALDCYWHIPDHEQYLNTILEMPRRRTRARSTDMVLDRLNQMPEEFIRSHPMTDLVRGLLYLNNLKISKAKEVLLTLAESLEGKKNDEEEKLLLGDVYTALADVSFAQNNLEGVEYVLKASPLLPEGTRIHSDNTLSVGNNGTFFLPDSEPGRLDLMRKYIFDFMEPAKCLYNDSGRGYAHLFAAEAAYCAERFEEVMEYSTRAIHIAVAARQADIVGNAMYAQIRLMLHQGDCERAGKILAELTGYIDDNRFTSLYGLRDCAAAMFHIRLNEIAKVPSWLSGVERLSIDIPMDVGRDRIVCASYMFAAGDFEGAHVVLSELDEVFIERPMWSVRVAALILKAACLLHMHLSQKAIDVFRQAYDMTWRNDIVILFAEFGADAAALVEAIRSLNKDGFDAGWLDRVHTSALACEKRRTAMRKRYGSEYTRIRRLPTQLSPREMQVLKYLSQGLSRKDIQASLGITLHGVKKHIASIYNKLGAVNRVDAIHIAVAHGLIEP